MNFLDFSFDARTRDAANTLARDGSLPHALIIEGRDKEAAANMAVLLSMFAVCEAPNRPCGTCIHCRKAKKKEHPDITFVPPDKDSRTNKNSIEQIRDITKDAYIIPNEAKAKVYIFENADYRLTPVVQNAFLKLLEEPPQGVHFLLLCENAQQLLITIRSRCAVLRLRGNDMPGEQTLSTAVQIARGILSSREYDLLLALRVLEDKQTAPDVLSALQWILRDAAAVQTGGRAAADAAVASELSARFTKKKLLRLYELCDAAALKITQNVNSNLLTTWLCGELRRISWQR